MITANYIKSNLERLFNQQMVVYLLFFNQKWRNRLDLWNSLYLESKSVQSTWTLNNQKNVFLTLTAYCFNEKYFIFISFVNLTKIYKDWAMLFPTAIADLSMLDNTIFASVFMFSLAQTNVHLNKKTHKNAHAHYVKIVNQLYVRIQMAISCCPVCWNHQSLLKIS